ncbi:MAG: iron ABC transporter permease [Anaerolineae bacterium]|nr:iron ABC transporter permease [Anaerolineae bacterium]
MKAEPMQLTRSIFGSGSDARWLTALRAPMRRVRRRSRTMSILTLIAALTVAVTLLPIAYLAVRALGSGSEGLAYALSPRTLAVVGNSIALAAAVAISAALVGVPFAWLTTRTTLPLRRFWLVAGSLPMVIPSYIGAMIFIAAFGPRGLAADLLAPLGVEKLPPIYGFVGAWLSITLFTYPFVALPVRAALLNTDPAQEEAARSLGLRRRAVFWQVTLPQLRPALAAGMLLSALYALSDFGAVALMRFDAFTRVIYTQYTSSFDRERAAVLALMLVAVTVAILVLERRVSRRGGGNYRAGTGCARRSVPIRLGVWAIPALLFCVLLVGVGVALPVGLLGSWLLRGAAVGAELSPVVTPTLNSLSASLLSALASALLAIPPAYLALRSRSRFRQWLGSAAYLGNALPGLVVALAFVFFASNFLPSLYQTMPILILGYCTRFLPLSIGATRSALTQINPRLEDAGRGLGLRRWQVILRITAPLARAGITSGAALVFLSAMKELPTTLLLAPTGFETLPADIWTATSEARFAQIAAPALFLVVVAALSLMVMLWQERQTADRL